jgi:ribosomal protein L44E
MMKWTEHYVSEEKPTRASKEREGQRRIEKGQMRPRMM